MVNYNHTYVTFHKHLGYTQNLEVINIMNLTQSDITIYMSMIQVIILSNIYHLV